MSAVETPIPALQLVTDDLRRVIRDQHPIPWKYSVEEDSGRFLYVLRDDNKKLIARAPTMATIKLIAFVCRQAIDK